MTVPAVLGETPRASNRINGSRPCSSLGVRTCRCALATSSRGTHRLVRCQNAVMTVSLVALSEMAGRDLSVRGTGHRRCEGFRL
jgi:hypothetical protein